MENNSCFSAWSISDKENRSFWRSTIKHYVLVVYRKLTNFIVSQCLLYCQSLTQSLIYTLTYQRISTLWIRNVLQCTSVSMLHNFFFVTDVVGQYWPDWLDLASFSSIQSVQNPKGKFIALASSTAVTKNLFITLESQISTL